VPDPSCHHWKLKNSLGFALAFQEDILITSPLSSLLPGKLDVGILLSQLPKASRSYEVSGLIHTLCTPTRFPALCLFCGITVKSLGTSNSTEFHHVEFAY